MKESGTRIAYFENDVVLPKESGRGLKVGDYPSQGTYGWRDITAPITVRGVRATDPTWAQIGSSDFYAYQFAVADYVWQPFHIPHDIVPGSAFHFHAHWLSDGTSTNAVTWEFKYAYAKGFNQQPFDVALSNSPLTNSGVVTASEAASGTAHQHMVTETDAVTIPDLTEPDGIIYVRLGRVNNATSPIANNTDGIFLLTADIHYQSTNMATKQKAPNFYAG